jgi:hypothetical protein
MPLSRVALNDLRSMAMEGDAEVTSDRDDREMYPEEPQALFRRILSVIFCCIAWIGGGVSSSMVPRGVSSIVPRGVSLEGTVVLLLD